MSFTLIFDPDSIAENKENLLPLGKSGYWASKELLQDEAALWRAIEVFQGQKSPLKLDAEKLATEKARFIACSKSRIDKAELDEQICAVFGTFERSARLSVITGPPGAAKSTIAGLWMQFVRMQYPAMPVVLIAQEKTALDRLYDKINFDGACAWTSESAMQRDWPREAAIIIDEAGILCTQTMAILLQKAAKYDALKVILIGDDKQLVPNAPGQPFRFLCLQEKIDKILLTQSFRQKTSELRHAVKALYNETVSAALPFLPFSILPPDEILSRVRQLAERTTSEKTMIAVHGSCDLIAEIKLLCPGFRVLSLAAAQGLAIDRVIFVLAQEINRAELLVGCSRQRYALDLLIDSGIYADANEFAEGVAPFPVTQMALDIVSPNDLLEILD